MLVCNYHFPDNFYKIRDVEKYLQTFLHREKKKVSDYLISVFSMLTQFLIKKFGCECIISILCCFLLILWSCPLFLTGLAGVHGMPFTRMSLLRVLRKALRGNSEIIWEIEFDPQNWDWRTKLVPIVAAVCQKEGLPRDFWSLMMAGNRSKLKQRRPMLLYKKEHSMDSIFLSHTGAHTHGDGLSVREMLNAKTINNNIIILAFQ